MNVELEENATILRLQLKGFNAVVQECTNDKIVEMPAEIKMPIIWPELDLKYCDNCGTKAVKKSSCFCHQCGNKLN